MPTITINPQYPQFRATATFTVVWTATGAWVTHGDCTRITVRLGVY